MVIVDLDTIRTALRSGILFLIAGQVVAMDSLSEHELSAVSGRDGVTINLQSDSSDLSNGIEISQISWATDQSSVVDSNTLFVDQIDIVPVGPLGGVATSPLDISVAIDAFTNTNSGRPSLAIDLFWERMRVSTGAIYMADDTSATFGRAAFDSNGRFVLKGDGGILNSTATDAGLLINLGSVDASDPAPSNWTINSPSQFYYAQNNIAGSSELVLDNLGFLFNMQQGAVGVDSDGIIVRSAPGSRTDFHLTFDILYDQSGSSPFEVTAEDLPVLHFGWRGGWENLLFQLQGKGAWPSEVHNQGLTASLGFDFADDYQVILGEAAGSKAYIELSAPESLLGSGLGSTSYSGKDFQIGYLTLDTLHASRGPGGICFGANTGDFGVNGAIGCVSGSGVVAAPEQVNIAPEDNAFALIARDWRLRGYSSEVVYRDEANGDVIDENWALIYTFGDLDANIYSYPQFGGGLYIDVVAALQTFGATDQERWQNGSHFMIGDTDNNLAIGLVGADLLFAANNMQVGLGNSGLSLDSPQARFQIRGMLGGGDIPNMAVPQSMAYVDINLESDRFVFGLEPAPLGQSYLGYSAFLSLTDLNVNNFSNQQGGAHGSDDGSYISLAEPSLDRLAVDFRLADLSGDIEIDNGMLDLRTSSETDHGRPELRISHTLKLGGAAVQPAGAAGDVFKVGRVEFGNRELGSIVVPAGQMNAALILKEQR
ncbi:hypothetical protein [Alcanivorax sp. DP30]|uniref:hypothetical protein n=1 Tax=Alcanivorax sp. DP30 TaxID=2606217 RepID=UPI00136B7AF8|nr:hypothetical protein [Alcanivorax sp. DP30]MZR61834.1 hypothetical protein [Alcanivorax sp. DP30]